MIKPHEVPNRPEFYMIGSGITEAFLDSLTIGATCTHEDWRAPCFTTEEIAAAKTQLNAEQAAFDALSVEEQAAHTAEGGLATTTIMKCNNGVIKTSRGFKFCQANDVAMSYAAAEQFCSGNNLQLVEPFSAEKGLALDDICGGDCTWLGLTCPAEADADCDTGFSSWVFTNSGQGLQSGNNQMKMDSDGTIYGGGANEFNAHWWFKPAGGAGQWGPQSASSPWYGAVCEFM